MDNVKYFYFFLKIMVILFLLKEFGYEYVYIRELKGFTWIVWKVGSFTIIGFWFRFILFRIIWLGICGFVIMEIWYIV